jgi:hypothetical protein
VIWLLILFVADPVPVYSMALLLMLVINTLRQNKNKIEKNKRTENWGKLAK